MMFTTGSDPEAANSVSGTRSDPIRAFTRSPTSRVRPENASMLATLGLAKSNSEARQKVTEGAVTVGPDREKITDFKATVAVTNGLIVRLGSRRVVRVRIV